MLLFVILCSSIVIVANAEEGFCTKERVEMEEMKEDLEEMWPSYPPLDCSTPNIDAATMTSDLKTYFFKDEYYWRLIGKYVAPGYPRLITQDWDGLPGHLDAALTWKDGRTFFFKGSEYWSFHGKIMDADYPRNISEGFCGLPDNIDAAVMWKPNNLAYFFKGNQYWRFDGGEMCRPVHKDYPMSIIREWENTPVNIDAALQWENGRTYIIKGKYYWRYNDNGDDSEAGRPVELHKNWGLDCEQLRCNIIRRQKTNRKNNTNYLNTNMLEK